MFGNTFGRLFKITCSGESYSGGFRKNPNIPSELYGGLITIVDGGTLGIGLMDALLQCDRVYVLDAVLCDKAPGSICRLTDAELAARPMAPVTRQREVSKALKAYAAMVSSADKGAVRLIDN